MWAISVSLGKDIDGKRVRRTFYAPTRAELQRRVMAERARNGGTIVARLEGNFEDWVDAWREEHVQPDRFAATYASYEAVSRVHVQPILGAVEMGALGVDHVANMVRRLRAAGVSPSMIGRALRVMHRATAVAIRQGRYARANPFALVERPRVESREMRS